MPVALSPRTDILREKQSVGETGWEVAWVGLHQPARSSYPQGGEAPYRPPPQGWGHASLSSGSGFPLLSRPLPPEDQKPPRDDLFLTTVSLPPLNTRSRHQPITSCGSGSAAGPVQADSAAWICICKTKQRDTLVLIQTSERKALR